MTTVQILIARYEKLQQRLLSRDASPAQQTRLLARLEELDEVIAKSLATNIDDLRLKLERLSSLLHPAEVPIVEDCLEHIYLAQLLRDVNHLTATTR